MKRKRRNFTSELKAQVAIEALKGQETLAQLSERFNVSSVMISNWKSEFENGLKMREEIRWYITYYNNRRPHQGIEHKIPPKLYLCPEMSQVA